MRKAGGVGGAWTLGPELGQISYIDILEPFAQMSNKRRISHKLGCEIKQETLSAKL